MKFTPDELATVSHSVAELDGLAFDIKCSSSIGGRGEKWDSPADQASYLRLKALADNLRTLREKMAMAQ